MKDFIERAEDAAEREYDEITKDAPVGFYKCPGCGKVASLEDDAHPISPDPWAMPGCGDCLEAALSDFKEKLEKNMEPIPPEFSKIVDKYFWELI
jgi:hypothetical protein